MSKNVICVKNRSFKGMACDRGVSPVIGVILMVAITVVLASVLYVWAIQLVDQKPKNENRTIVANVYTASDADWILTAVTTTGTLKINDLEFVVLNTYGIEVARNAASENNTPATLGKQKIYAYTSSTNMSAAISISTDLGKLANVSFVLMDSNGNNELDAGDALRIYDDTNNDALKEVQSGYTIKIFERDSGVVFEKHLP
ncbi:MAG: archaellin/type IV pilin N-terminal domain-containing protein [Thermoplasmata archaeon]